MRTVARTVAVGVIGLSGALGLAPAVASAACPNEPFRTGRSASLPDCRAYELVTPEVLARTQDLTFSGLQHAAPSSDGEHLLLLSPSTLEPNPDVAGTTAVFSRTPLGWAIKSAVSAGAGEANMQPRLVSPDLSQLAFVSFVSRNNEELQRAPQRLEAGPVGGPYRLVAEVPAASTFFEAANTGAGAVPAFSRVLLSSSDDQLLPPGPERSAAEEALPGAQNLYQWSEGRLSLLNMNATGKLVSPCGAALGHESDVGEARHTVSADGAIIFFTTALAGSGCPVPTRLWMRTAGGPEPVEVSAPQEVVLQPSERRDVTYLDATADGSAVFFTTSEALTPDAPHTGSLNLYVYRTGAPAGQRLRFIATGYLAAFQGDRPGPNGHSFVLSEDGSSAYYADEAGRFHRYDMATGETTPALRVVQSATGEPIYTTPDGEYLVVPALTVEGQPQTGHVQLYRYDNRDGSVICVSCGEGVASADIGSVIEPLLGFGQGPGDAFIASLDDGVPALIQASEDGQEVFFQTTSRLVAQDRNPVAFDPSSIDGFLGLDVYEWEADGAGACRVSGGCVYLLSGGEETGQSVFLGASRDGSNVFLATAAPLLPWATPEFTNIYDARVDGGFPRPPARAECLACQGVGSPSPSFAPAASATFAGAGNPPLPSTGVSVTPKPKPRPRSRCRRSLRRNKHGRCVRAAHKSGRGHAR
jgi:hypothetical protein